MSQLENILIIIDKKMDVWQAIMVVVAILCLLITFVNAITNERLRRLQSYRLAFEMCVWRNQNYKRQCNCNEEKM